MEKIGNMTEEQAYKKTLSQKVEPKRRGMTPKEAVEYYNKHLKVKQEPEPKESLKEDPWWLKPLLILFAAFILFGMISMCNHSLRESSNVGIETTIRSHGD